MIQSQKLKAFMGLKWDPFLPEVPVHAMHIDESVSQFNWKVEQLVLDGGFALVSGDPGTGKSVVLRQLSSSLSQIPELCVRVLTRPQNRLRDFYREMSSLFGVAIQVSNRYGGFQRLREQWVSQIHNCMFRPVLLIDESQEVPDEVLNEIRLLGSADLDARCILAVVFAGDKRFLANIKQPSLLPLESRIRTRIHLDARSPESMRSILTQAITEAGNAELLTPGVIRALAEQSMGNPRCMMTMAHELLSHAVMREQRQIDENMFFEVFRLGAKKKKGG